MMSVRLFINQNSFALLRILPILLFIIVVSAKYGAAAGPLRIYVVNYPLKYFAERIGGDYVQVEFPVPGNVDPAYWDPDIADISAYQKADLIMLNGAAYAKWVGILKSLGVSSLVFEPCGNVPAQGNFMTVMQRNVEDLRRAFPEIDYLN